MTANLKHRVELLEKRISGPGYSAEFDEDALTIYGGMVYMDATMSPSYHEVEPTAIYARGKELSDRLYGPTIPATVDQHLKRYTRASGEFELAFGREPKEGDLLLLEYLKLTHSPENLSNHFGRLSAAWQRQFPDLTCPLKFEGGGLSRRLALKTRDAAAQWEEDITVQAEARWLAIPEVLRNTDLDAMLTISAVVFVGVVGAKHVCRPATEDDMQNTAKESPGEEPTGFMFGKQRQCDILVDVLAFEPRFRI